MTTPAIKFIEKANQVHNSQYDYSEINYIKSSVPIKIICPHHGSFMQRPGVHLRGCGCPECAVLKVKTHGVNRRVTTAHIIDKFKQVHGDVYDYSLVEYIRDDDKVSIICRVHGIFLQKASNHYNGKGCYACGRLSSGKSRLTSVDEFVTRAKRVHGTKYDYSGVEYTTLQTKVSILCKKHGSFDQLASNHLQGYGCPKCGHRISTGESAWLDYMKVPVCPINRQVILWADDSRYTVDGFDPITNTVYEYHGDYWHGNPKYHRPHEYNSRTKCTFGELYDRTMLKHKKLEMAGYRVVFTWASDWLQSQKLLHQSERPDLFV